jgi:MFS family permease
MDIVTTSTAAMLIAPAPLIPTIFMGMKREPGATAAATMVTFQFCVATSALLSGFIIDKLGAVRIWIIGLGLVIAGSLLMPVMGNSLSGLTFCRFLQGIGTGPIMATIVSVCASRFSYKERPYVASAQGFSVSLGIAIGLVFSPWMLKMTGNWQTALQYCAILPIIGIVFALIVEFGPKPPVIHTLKIAEGSSKAFSGDFKRALGFYTVYILAAMAFIDSWCQQGFQDLTAPYYGSPKPLGLGLSASAAGSKLAWASIAMMAGTIVAPIITDKIFKGKGKYTVSFGLAVAAVFVFSVRFLTADNTVLLALVPCGILFFSSFVNPTVFGFISRNYPDTIAGRIGGLVMGVSVYGATVGVAIGSRFLTVYKSYHPAMNLMVAVVLVGGAFALLLNKPKGFVTEEIREAAATIARNTKA